ncbi:hypothetical protein J6590_052115 [Homalodisca vitripennis]|nr:hypothetical protein J6590_052115 [Homalodisca vitripennis]
MKLFTPHPLPQKGYMCTQRNTDHPCTTERLHVYATSHGSPVHHRKVTCVRHLSRLTRAPQKGYMCTQRITAHPCTTERLHVYATYHGSPLHHRKGTCVRNLSRLTPSPHKGYMCTQLITAHPCTTERLHVYANYHGSPVHQIKVTCVRHLSRLTRAPQKGYMCTQLITAHPCTTERLHVYATSHGSPVHHRKVACVCTFPKLNIIRGRFVITFSRGAPLRKKTVGRSGLGKEQRVKRDYPSVNTTKYPARFSYEYTQEIFGRANQVDTINIDFPKAFDKVDHTVPLNKLRGHESKDLSWSGIPRTLLAEGSSYESALSYEFISTSGVPQSSNLDS